MTPDDWWKEPRPWTDWLGHRTPTVAAAQETHEQRTRSLGPTNTVQLAAASPHPRPLRALPPLAYS